MPADSVRAFGVQFDSEMNMHAHISKITQTCFLHLRRLHQIRRLVGRDVTATLVSALVISRLDYGNAVLAGLSLVYCTITARLEFRRPTGVRTSTTRLCH